MTNVAGVILVRKDGAVLLQHRDNKEGIFYPDYWCYPGGVMELEELPEEAARRELFEETGYRADSLFPLLADTYERSDGEKMIPHAFCAILDGKQEIRCNEGQEIIFVHPDDFGGKKFIPTQEHLLRLASLNSSQKQE